MREGRYNFTFLTVTMAVAVSANACSYLVSTSDLSGGGASGDAGPARASNVEADSGIALHDAGPVAVVAPAADASPPAVPAPLPPPANGAAPPDASASDACVATAPACDGKDHACDGIINKGCPSALTIGAPGPSQLLGGDPTAETPFSDACPAGQVLIGMGGSTGQWIDSIYGICGAVNLSAVTWTVPYTYAVTIAGGATLPTEGYFSWSDTSWEVTCPSDQAVVGVAGNSGAAMDHVTLACAPLVITGTPGAFELHQGTITALPPQGGGGGSPFTPVACPDPQVITLISGSAGNSVDSLAVACAAPALDVR